MQRVLEKRTPMEKTGKKWYQYTFLLHGKQPSAGAEQRKVQK